jgi:quinol monooxygenase YgiN
MEGAMVGGLKILLVKPGHEQEFESLFVELRKAMHEHEPDCLLYSLLKSRTDPRAYIVHEQYRNQPALDAHQVSPYGKVLFPKIRAILESITVEYFDGVVP